MKRFSPRDEGRFVLNNAERFNQAPALVHYLIDPQPDLGIDDLRLLHLASPFLRVEYVRGPLRPSWLPVDASLDFRDWASVGRPPPALSALFPDL